MVWLPCKQALLFCQPLVTFRKKKISFYSCILLMLLHKGSQNNKLALSLSPREDYTVASDRAGHWNSSITCVFLECKSLILHANYTRNILVKCV